MRNRIILLVCLPLIFLVQGCYLLKQGKGQLEIWCHQVPLDEAIRLETNDNTRSLLKEVPNIKKFAEERLQLDHSETYSDYYSTDKEGIAFVVTACPKTELEPYEWWFPVIGSVPYKGYFDKNDALELEEKLREEGYDTWIFTAPAYSTLGWFDDPITTPMLDGGRFSLADTIFHELTHQKIFIDDQVEFNEQLATFVGVKGAFSYFSEAGSIDVEEIERIKQERNHLLKLYQIVKSTLLELDELYQSGASTEQILVKREAIFNQLTRDIITRFPKAAEKDWRFNNARIVQYRRYQPNAPRIEEIWEQSDHNWIVFWELIDQYVKSNFE